MERHLMRGGGLDDEATDRRRTGDLGGLINPEDYLSEANVLAKWPMLTSKELRKARKGDGIRFYAFRGGPCYTPAQVQDYIDRTYLRGLKSEKPAELSSPQPVPAATAVSSVPAGMTPELAAAAAELLAHRIPKKPKSI